MAYDPERVAEQKRDEEEIRKARQRAQKEAERKRRLAEEALKRTVKK